MGRSRERTHTHTHTWIAEDGGTARVRERHIGQVKDVKRGQRWKERWFKEGWRQSCIWFTVNRQKKTTPAISEPKLAEYSDRNKQKNKSVSQQLVFHRAFWGNAAYLTCEGKYQRRAQARKQPAGKQHTWRYEVFRRQRRWCVVYFMVLFLKLSLHFPPALQRSDCSCVSSSRPRPHTPWLSPAPLTDVSLMLDSVHPVFLFVCVCLRFSLSSEHWNHNRKEIKSFWKRNMRSSDTGSQVEEHEAFWPLWWKHKSKQRAEWLFCYRVLMLHAWHVYQVALLCVLYTVAHVNTFPGFTVGCNGLAGVIFFKIAAYCNIIMNRS